MKPWPVARPRTWLTDVNAPQDDDTIASVRRSAARGVPLGEKAWQMRAAGRLGLDITLRPRGRPRNDAKNSS